MVMVLDEVYSVASVAPAKAEKPDAAVSEYVPALAPPGKPWGGLTLLGPEKSDEFQLIL
jgi:hypothetical protein